MYLHPELSAFFSKNLLEDLLQLQGEVFRSQKNRKTQRVKIGEKTFFIKQYHGTGWKEIFKNLLQLRLPVLSAKNEWQALNKLKTLNILAPEVFAYDIQGKNPARLQSAILMNDLINTTSLEQVTEQWKVTRPSVKFKRYLLREVAHIAKIMHANGINHRDFYICHFLLDKESRLFLIDLHRAQIRKKTPERWIIKDLAGLYFSSKHIGLTRTDLLYFMQCYQEKNYSKMDKTFWDKVKDRGDKLYAKYQ